MPSLLEQIAAAIRTEGPLWFPGLAPALAVQVVAAPGRNWVDGGYGTARWLAADEAAPRDGVATIPLAGGRAIIERLDPAARARFGDLAFAEAPPAAQDLLEGAVALLTQLPGMDNLLGALVRAIHLLSTAPGYDISHSDPDVPFSIFVSLPSPSEPHALARVAESILHETLHLQLTLIEAICPLVAKPQHEGYSPWKAQTRPLGGLLHGIYVFASIREALDGLAPRTADLATYAQRRRGEIADELQTLGPSPDGLTDKGQQLWARALKAAA